MVRFQKEILISLLVILVCHFNFNSLTFAITISELDLNSAEKYVLKKVKKGEEANLQKQFPEKMRTIKGQFLRRLITNQIHDLKVSKNGIRIYGARIKAPFYIYDAIIPFSVSLLSCIFDKEIGFGKTTFSGKANFSGTEFSESVIFRDAEFSESAIFSKTQFFGKAYFSDTKFSKIALFSKAIFSEEANFAKANFSGEASFSGAKFSGRTIFSRANFSGEASFSGAKFSGKAIFLHTKFFGKVKFSKADFSERVTFLGVIFSGEANFLKANLSGKANFSRIDFSEGVNFSLADLRKANFSKADLSKADLKEADLKDCKFDSYTKLPLVYEPKAGSPPYIPSIASFPNLSSLTFKNSPHGLVDLREGFKNMGYRTQEREITYAIKRTQRRKLWNDIYIWNKFESLFYFVFFELTCKYGMKPGRPLILLICLIPLFSLFYIFALKSKGQKTGLWLIFSKERVLKATKKKEERPFKLTAKFPPRVITTDKLSKIKLRLLRSYRMIRLALYFSMLSATSIGWREFNVGNWISRLQRREYTLRATGWVRTISGLQSLISVYLLALWVLTYFGRPFEAV